MTWVRHWCGKHESWDNVHRCL